MLNDFSFLNHTGRKDLALGIVIAPHVNITQKHPELETRLEKLLVLRKDKLADAEEKVRSGSRDILRNGTYKPTGRGKPAAEYLLRECQENKFPRVNTAVDINNYISLRYLVAISLWDTDLAAGKQYNFRLGKKGESYVFNSTGQTIDLEDLITGFVIQGHTETPIVTPVKDSLRTKTTPQSQNMAMVIYYPIAAGSRDNLEAALAESCGLFAAITPKTPSWAIIVGA